LIAVKLGKLEAPNKFEYQRRMTKHECRMTKEAQSPNDEAAIKSFAHLIIRHSLELRHSDFGIFRLNSGFSAAPERLRARPICF